MGRQITVGIFHDPEAPMSEGASNPDRIAQIVKKMGFHPASISRSQLADESFLTPSHLPVLVLCKSPYLPEDAVRSLRNYLKRGGRFLALGGYAFDRIYGWGEEEPHEYGERWSWSRVGPPELTTRVTERQFLLSVPASGPIGFYGLRASVSVHPGAHYLLSAEVAAEGIRNGAGAYLAAEYWDSKGNRLSFQETRPVRQTDGWEQVTVWLAIPPDAAQTTVSCLINGTGKARFRKIRLTRGLFPSFNTRWATARDWLHVQADQVGVFDPGFRIDGTVTLEGLPPFLPQTLRLGPLRSPIKGYAAVALTGSNDPVRPVAYSRLIPLLQARDRFGRYLGPAFSLVYHFDGPFKGGSWAICGIDNRDICALPNGDRFLTEALRRLVFSSYLHSLRPAFWAYRPNESVRINLKVANYGLFDAQAAIRLEIFPSPKPLAAGPPILMTGQEVTLTPGAEREVAFRWKVPQSSPPLFLVKASATFLPSGLQDEIWSGVCVWTDSVLGEAPPIRWHQNGLEEWDPKSRRWERRFLTGTNQTGVLFAVDWENPFQWESEFALMNRMGLRILRVLHISAFAGDLTKPTEEFWRRYDALVLMSHRHNLILMPCLHDWTGGVTVSDEALHRQSLFAQMVAKRYRKAPRIVWDIENEATVEVRDLPDIRRLFNTWLRERYSSWEELKQVWGKGADFGNIPFQAVSPTDWTDRRVVDIQQFRRWLIRRWVENNVRAVRSAGASQPITDEIDWKVGGDHYEGSRFLTFTNLHYYGERTPLSIAAYLKFMERHKRGHGLAVGEFGARDHPSFSGGWGYAPTQLVVRHFITLPLLVRQLGGAFALNWDWKDMEGCIFPWGLIAPHGVRTTVEGRQVKGEAALKVSGRAFSIASRLLSLLPLRSSHPDSLLLVIPDSHLLGPYADVGVSGTGPAGPVSSALFHSIRALLILNVPFSVLREWEFPDWLKQERSLTGRILVFPIPFVWSEETFQAVSKASDGGGSIIITGDFTFLPDRRTRDLTRVLRLCGAYGRALIRSPLDGKPSFEVMAKVPGGSLKRWKGSIYLGLTVHGSDVRVLARTASGEPAIISRRRRNGQVLYCADAPEFRSAEQTAQIYDSLLSWAGYRPYFSPSDQRFLNRWADEIVRSLLLGHPPPDAIPLAPHWREWTPLRSGTVEIPAQIKPPHFLVRDPVTGAILTRLEARAVKDRAVVTVPDDLILTLWRHLPARTEDARANSQRNRKRPRWR